MEKLIIDLVLLIGIILMPLGLAKLYVSFIKRK